MKLRQRLLALLLASAMALCTAACGNSTETTTETEKETISYTITEDQHTQTGETIWIVKPEKELSKTDFAEVKRKLATIQGYYSTFKHGFIFKYNPTEALQTG